MAFAAARRAIRRRSSLGGILLPAVLKYFRGALTLVHQPDIPICKLVASCLGQR
jgi:hypothetical protein